MFRHKTTPIEPEKIIDPEKVVESKPPLLSASETTPKSTDVVLKELMEKNLKWSQIIYEQNRKINNKMMWAAVASWFRMLVIFVPLVLVVWFLAPQAKNIYSLYQQLLNFQTPKNITTSNSLEQIMKLFPINSAQEQQLKAILR